VLLGIALAAMAQVGSDKEAPAQIGAPTGTDDGPSSLGGTSTSVDRPFGYRVGLLAGVTTTNFWEYVAFLANSAVFLLIGLDLEVPALVANWQPVLWAMPREFGLRLLYTLLRGVTRDRLDLLGEEYFHYVLRPQLHAEGVEQLKEWMAANGQVVLVSQGLEQVVRPLAEYLGVERLAANRLEFREGVATGRLLEPILRPRGVTGLWKGTSAVGRVERDGLLRELGFAGRPERIEQATVPARRPAPQNHRPLVVFDRSPRTEPLSVRETLRGKQILLIGVTGFIGKVWLSNLLTDLPEIGKIHLLIRRQKSNTAKRRWEKIVEESPVFDPLAERHGAGFAKYLSERVEVVEGDVSQPGLGIEPETRERLLASVDLVVNSSGLVDFNPDLREALAINVEGTAHLIDFIRASKKAGLLHLSTCYVAGARDGRVSEELKPNYTPVHQRDYDAERERQQLEELVKKVEERSEGRELTAALLRQAKGKRSEARELTGAQLEAQIQKNRQRWLKNRLIKVGMQRAKRLGWPNTYTFTKSLAESLIATRAADLPVAVVRPSIVETSTAQPFRGWNEGVNTSAPLAYLLGTNFRQLPTNERKCLDVIPVDLVCRGMTLIAAAIVGRRHERLYQLATSASNPCDMGRSIELTGLAHRKHYRAQQGLEHWLKLRLDTIPVSKARYRRLSVPAQKAVVSGINRVAAALAFKKPPLARAERDLARLEKLIELYEPFILLNEHVFEAENVKLLSQALPAEEQAAFGYDDGGIDWWEYWINIHVPALRKWCYPLMEGRALEPRPKRELKLPPAFANGTETNDAAMSESEPGTG